MPFLLGGSHTVEAYSSVALTQLLHARSLTLGGAVLSFHLRNQNFRSAQVQKADIWGDQVSLLFQMIPRKLHLSTVCYAG